MSSRGQATNRHTGKPVPGPGTLYESVPVDVQCFKCKRTGHYANECPFGPLTCEKCGGKGHDAKAH
jgi:hypothetical protein